MFIPMPTNDLQYELDAYKRMYKNNEEAELEKRYRIVKKWSIYQAQRLWDSGYWFNITEPTDYETAKKAIEAEKSEREVVEYF